MKRNEFISRCTVWTVGIACADLGLMGCATLQYADYLVDGEKLVLQKTELEARGYALLNVPSLPAPVHVAQRDGDLKYDAVLLRCTHRGCTVRRSGNTLDCPCHGSRYTTGGRVLEGPASRDLSSYEVSEDESSLFIHIQ